MPAKRARALSRRRGLPLREPNGAGERAALTRGTQAHPGPGDAAPTAPQHDPHPAPAGRLGGERGRKRPEAPANPHAPATRAARAQRKRARPQPVARAEDRGRDPRGPRPLGVVAHPHARHLLLGGVGEDGERVVAGDRDVTEVAVLARGGPVRARPERVDAPREVLAAHDRGVVGHRPRHAQLGPGPVHRDPVMGRVEDVVLAARRGRGAQRQPGDAGDPLSRQVELHEPVEERDLEVEPALVRGQGHWPHGRAHVGVAGLGELLGHVVGLEHGEGTGVDNLEHARALARVERRVVGGGVDAPDAGVEDPAAVARVDVLMRCVAGGKGPDDPPRHRVEHVHDAWTGGGCRRYHQSPAVGRDRHVIGAHACERPTPDDLARGEADRHDVVEARPRHVERAPVGRGVQVVDHLVVALPHLRAYEEGERRAIRGEVLELARLEVGDHVHAADPLEGRHVEHVRRPVPVVPDQQDGPGLGRGGGRHRERGQQQRERRDCERPHRAQVLLPKALVRTRTGDPFLTMEVLYQLSYEGARGA